MYLEMEVKSNAVKEQYCISSVTQSCWTLCDTMDYSTPLLPVYHQLLEFTQTHVHWLSNVINHLILSCSQLLLPSVFPSIRIFSNKSVLWNQNILYIKFKRKAIWNCICTLWWWTNFNNSQAGWLDNLLELWWTRKIQMSISWIMEFSRPEYWGR